MIANQEQNVKALAKLSLTELRQRQDTVAHSLRTMKSSEGEKILTLRQMHDDLSAAVNLKVFGDA